jgi:hypothetical protein
MMFGQLSGRQSLRDLLTCISAHAYKYHHLGFGKNVTRSNLSKANDRRNYRIYEEFAMTLVKEARRYSVNQDFTIEIEGNVYAVDSTTVDLCMNVFWWATFRSTKAAIKLHTEFDIRTAIPSFILVTPASVHDVNAIDFLRLERGAHYVLDRAYVDFKRLHRIHTHGSYFVTRAKHNIRFKTLSSLTFAKNTGVTSDQIIQLSGYNSFKRYPESLRRIRYIDYINNVEFVFLTNNTTLAAEDIALLYQHRWSIELFFKWIKQHLKIESFWGTSENSVKTQVYIAIATFCLITIIKHRLQIKRTPYEILQIIGVSLLDKTPLSLLLKSAVFTKENSESQFLLNFH